MKLLTYLREIKKSLSDYRPSIEILISKNNLIHNLNQFRALAPGLAFAPVLKSNAYGHGLMLVAKILDRENLPFLIVDSLFEARALKNEGIKSKILVIGYTGAENIAGCNLSKVAFTITGLDQLKQIGATLNQPQTFHLKIDTGMHRQGLLINEINEATELIKNNRLIKLEGICSHFADADGADETFTNTQIGAWKKTVEIFQTNFPQIKYYHLSNTAGSRFGDKIFANVGRLGLGLYGIDPSPNSKLNLKPPLHMNSIITSVKTIQPGSYVGYGITYKTDEVKKIATAPVGYFEGVDLRLSNKGYFKVGEKFCPIVGRVSMNITSVDVSSVSDVKLGDPVTIISSDKTDPNSVENIAKLIGTIPYEILVHIPQHLRRSVI